MRKLAALFVAVLLIGLCSACGNSAEAKESKSAENEEPIAGTAGNRPAEDPADTPDTDSTGKSKLYDPSIFVIEASGSWRQELAPGYFADYECELYLDKFDANDNRSASGLYTGVFWMKTSVDAADYLRDFLKDAPVEMDFEAGGEGVCDNLTIHLLDGYERDPFGDYAIPDGQGGETPPAKEALAGEGGFIAQGMQAYLDASARGAGGETLTHQDSQTGDAEISYVIQVEPDPDRTAAERKVTIHLSGAGGMSATIEGVWRRLPGYRDDMLDYANAGKSAEVLNRRLP